MLILLLVGVFWASAAPAQTTLIKLPTLEMSVKEVIDQIQRQSRFRIAYSSPLFDVSRTVRFETTELPLPEVLRCLVEGSGFWCIPHEEMIIVSPVPVEEISAALLDGPVSLPDELPEAPPLDTVAVVRDTLPVRFGPVSPVACSIVQVPGGIDGMSPFRQTEPPGLSLKDMPDLVAARITWQPVVSLKTNALHWAAGGTPNLSIELKTGRRTSIELSGAYNPWERDGGADNTKKLSHWMIRPEIRYWFGERMKGHFLAANLSYWQYDISGYSVPIPLLFKADHRYKGNLWGGGITYGYHWLFGRNAGLEVSFGFGVSSMRYKKYDCTSCEDYKEHSKTYFGATNAGISLVFVLAREPMRKSR